MNHHHHRHPADHVGTRAGTTGAAGARAGTAGASAAAAAGDSQDEDPSPSMIVGSGGADTAASTGHAHAPRRDDDAQPQPLRAAGSGVRGRRQRVTSREEFGSRGSGADSPSGAGGGAGRRVVTSRGEIGLGDGASDTGVGAGADVGAGVAGPAPCGGAVPRRSVVPPAHAAPGGPPSRADVRDGRSRGSASSSLSSIGDGGRGGGPGGDGPMTGRGRAGAPPAVSNGRPRVVLRSQSYYDRLMMPPAAAAPAAAGHSYSSGRDHPPSEPEASPHSTTGSSGGSDPDLMVLCRAGRWDEVREWLRRRRERDDDDPCTASSFPSRRREVSACPRGGGVEAAHTAHATDHRLAGPAHFADAAWAVAISGKRHHRRIPPCHCDTALSIACGPGGRPPATTRTPGPATATAPPHAPVDVVEALWRFCPDQLVHSTFEVAGEDASTPTVRVHPRASGTPLHHALWAVRWGEGGGEDGGGVRGVCSGLDLVECLVDAVVAVSGGGGGGGRGRGKKTPADEEEGEPPARTVALLASRLPDHGGRTPLQIWVGHVFPRLMALGGRRPGAAAAAAAAAISADDATPTPPDDHADDAVFDRWMDVLRRLLVAWPCACSVPDGSGATLLMTVLRWEALVPRGGGAGVGGGGGGDGGGGGGGGGAAPNGETIRRTTTPSRAVVERRLLDVVRIMLESSSSDASSGGATYWSCSSFGCSPLHYAVEYKRSSGVIGAVLDASSSSLSSSTMTRTSSTPLPLRRNNLMEVPLHVAAALRAPLSVMGLLLRRRRGGCSPADQATAVDRGGRSPLTWAYVRFLEHYHGTILSRREKNARGTGREDAGRGDAIVTPAEVPRARRKIIPRRLKAMEEEVLGSLQRCANREELLSELGPFWDVAQLLLISAHHGRGTATAASATPTPADARSFLGVEASARLTEQVRGVLAPGDLHGRRWRAVHAAASLPGCCPRGVLAIATMVHPDQPRERDEGGRLPLHLSIGAWCGGRNDPPSSSSRGDTAAPEEEASRTCWSHDETGPSAVQTVLTGFPDAAGMTDGPSERLPLHVAIEGLLPRLRETTSSPSSDDDDEEEEELRLMGWTVSSRAPPPRSILRNRMQPTKYTAAAAAALIEASLRHDVRRIAMAHPDALGEGDVAPTGDDTGTGRLLPFMVAAAGHEGSTCLSYELLREKPDVVCRFIPPSPGKNKGEADRGSGGSAASPGVRGPVPSSSGSSSPPTSPGRSIDGRGRGHSGDKAQKRARCS